jgi:SAM-dependent methyltransferase
MDKQTFYNSSDAYFAVLKNEPAEYYQEFIDLVKFYLQDKNSKILDLGCGTGQSSCLLSRVGYRVTGFDYSQRFIEHARKNFPEVNFVQGEVTALPFIDDSFDALVTYNTIEHFDDLEKGLREVARVVKKNGLIIIQAPNLISPKYPINAFLNQGLTFEGKRNFRELIFIFLRNLVWLAQKKIGAKPRLIYRKPIFDFNFPDNDAMSFLSPPDVKNLLELAGCQIVNYQTIDHLAKCSKLKKIASRLLPDFMGIIRIVARK